MPLYQITRPSRSGNLRKVFALSVGLAPASSPKGGALGRPGHFRLTAEGPTGRKRAGLAYGDSRFWTTHLVKLSLA